MKQWAQVTAPATVQAAGTVPISGIFSLTLHFALITLLLIPTIMNNPSDRTDSITVSLFQANEYYAPSNQPARTEMYQSEFSKTSEPSISHTSFVLPTPKHVGGRNVRRDAPKRKSIGLGTSDRLPISLNSTLDTQHLTLDTQHSPKSEISTTRLNPIRLSPFASRSIPFSGTNNNMELGIRSSEEDSVAKIKYEEKRVDDNSIYKSKFAKQSRELRMAYPVAPTNSRNFINSHSAAGPDVAFQDVAQGVMLGNADILPLRKGESGGIVVGKGRDIKGYTRFARVKCSMIDEYIVEFWWPKAFSSLLKKINAMTNIKADMNVEGSPILLTDSRLRKCPIIFLLGYDRFELWAPSTHNSRSAFRLKDSERKALRKYLVEEGGLLFIDTLPHRMWSADVPVCRWSFRMKAELREILPEYGIKRIPNDHELYRCFYRLGGAPLTAITSQRTPYLEGIFIDGRLAVIYSERAYVGSMTREGAYWSPQLATFKLMTNIIVYALTHGGISDYSRYVPGERITNHELRITNYLNIQ